MLIQLSLTFWGLVVLGSQGQALQHPCRSLDTRISYERHSPHSGYPLGYSTVLSVDVRNAKPNIIIYAPSKLATEREHFYTPQHFASDDRGASWEPYYEEVFSPLAIANIDLAQSPSDHNTRYKRLAETGRFLLSEDGGLTWVLPLYITEGMPLRKWVRSVAKSDVYHAAFSLAAIHPTRPKTVYATVQVTPWASTSADLARYDMGLFVSEDGGGSWKLLNEGIQTHSPVGISTSNPEVMFAVGRDTVVVKSNDSGKHWEPVGDYQRLSARPRLAEEQRTHVDLTWIAFEFSIRQIVVPNKNDVYIVSNKGIYYSANGGASWCLLDLGFDELDGVHSLALNPANAAELFVGTRRGTFFSQDRGGLFQVIFPGRKPLPARVDESRLR